MGVSLVKLIYLLNNTLHNKALTFYANLQNVDFAQNLLQKCLTLRKLCDII